MAELKPRLILTTPGKKRRGFGTLLFVLIIFAIGFYTGSIYGDKVLGERASESVSENNTKDNDKVGEFPLNEKGSERENSDIYGSGPSGGEEQEASSEEKEGGGFDIGSDPVSTTADSDNPGLLVPENNTSSGNTAESLTDDGFTDNPNEAPSNNEELVGNSATYTIQVGAFSTPEEAKSVADGYILKGYDAYIVPIVNSKGQRWNLIKIGRFDNIDKAWSYSSYLKNREGIEAYVESVDKETVFNESWNQGQNSEDSN